MDEKRLLSQVVAAARAGQRGEARRLLQEVLALNPRNEMAWLWLSTVVESDDQRVECLRRVLKINPENQTARTALDELRVKVTAPPPTSEQAIEDQDTQPSVQPPLVRCPSCGVDSPAKARLCSECGQPLHQQVEDSTPAEPAWMQASRSLEAILQTARHLIQNAVLSILSSRSLKAVLQTAQKQSQRVSFENAPALNQRSSGSKLGAIAGLIITLAFFLPWVRACNLELSGYDIATNNYGNVEDPEVYWITLLVGLFCIALFFLVKTGSRNKRIQAAVARLVAGAVGFWPLLNIWLNFKQKESFWKILFGGWITVLGYLGILASFLIDLAGPADVES